MDSLATDTPRLAELLDLFPTEALKLEEMEIVEPEEVPQPYSHLLVHEHHMTVTLEEYHETKVHLVVQARSHSEGVYCRRLALTAGRNGKVVLTGVIRFHMTRCSEAVRQQVLEERTPLGKILMEHCSLRRIRPHAYLRVQLSPQLRSLLGIHDGGSCTYGRTAIISCQQRPVVELLEVVAPVESPGRMGHAVSNMAAGGQTRP
jgi:chorismate-pyruvate lyase